MSSAFSSADTAVFDRETESYEEQIEISKIWSESKRNDCIQWIKANQFTKVNNDFLFVIHENYVLSYFPYRFVYSSQIIIYHLAHKFWTV